MTLSEPTRVVFKECPLCGFTWGSRDEFLSDPDVEIVGYQAHFEELTAGYLVFNHACETSMAVMVGQFRDLYDGPVFEEQKTGSEECLGYCLQEGELRGCPIQCECAFVREIIQLVQSWPKSRDARIAPARS
jgi:hypothetical protein